MAINSLIRFLDLYKIGYSKDYSTSNLTSLEVGGSAKLVTFPNNIENLCEVALFCYKNNIKFDVIGNGTNTFFCDSGYEGVIISTKFLDKIEARNDTIVAECGALVTDCAIKAMVNCLCGIEFLCGIPGSVGGAVTMNASAYEMDISNVIQKSKIINLSNGNIKTIECSEHKFNKKHSIFSQNKDLILLSTEFILKPSNNKDDIYSKLIEIAKKRITTQPLNMPSCGSAFKRPVGSYASKLIDLANLKGFTVGGAQISNKHAGFLINFNNASSQNILDLIEQTKNKIFNNFEVKLEEEILLLKWGKNGVIF